MHNKPRILMIDIETAPMKGVFWGLWKQNIALNQILEDWYILTYAGKWVGEEDKVFDGLIEYQDYYKKHPECDKQVLTSLRDLLDEADIVVAHNAVRFDIPKINARLIKHNIAPPSPYKVVDTLQVAKKKFKFTSNKLDYIAKYLGVGQKLAHQGMDMWLGCMNGDLHCWRDMIKYNIQDVDILEAVYLKLLPWMDNHPNVALYNDDETPTCPKCGGTHIHWRGYAYTNVSRFHRFQCKDCGGWGRARQNTIAPDKRKGVLANVI